MNAEQFEKAKNKIIGLERNRFGIGTLQEKTVHAVLKNYYAPDEDMHEIPIENYVADIYTGNEIIEIQNGNFDKIRAKLDAFLSLYPVTVVYPIAHKKWLIWIDEETGEYSAKRKSPATGNAYAAFRELYKIKQYLKHTNLKFCFPLIDIEEYRLLNGWSTDKKKGSHRFDRIPTTLADEVIIERKEDYLQFLPYDLPEKFTSGEFAKTAKIPAKSANLTLNILNYLEIVERIGKSGRFYLYQINTKLL